MISPIGIYHDDESRKAEKEAAALAYGGIVNSGDTMLKDFRKISKDCDMKIGTRNQIIFGNAKCPVAPRLKRGPGYCRMKICPKLFAFINGKPVEGPRSMGKDVLSIYEDRGNLLEALETLIGNWEEVCEREPRGELDIHDVAQMKWPIDNAKLAIANAERIPE